MQSGYATSSVVCDGSVSDLIADNIQALRQGVELIEQLDDHLYAHADQRLSLGGAGSHFRHCMDFYSSFLAGVGFGRINYDAREREARIENDRKFARGKLRSIIEGLGRLRAVATPAKIEVLLEGSSDQAGGAWSRSSVERELQFLLSHTIHHYALIALALRLQGFAVGTEFGVAPSTLKHWRRTA